MTEEEYMAGIMTERNLWAYVTCLLDEYVIAWHHCPDSRRCEGQRGFPDLIIVGTELLMVELKTQYTELTREQKLWGYRIKAAGGRWVTWRPQDLASGRIRREVETIA